MSNAWLSGSIARSITAKKRPRLFWNLFFSILLVLIIYLIGEFTVQLLNDYKVLNIEQTYQKIENGYLYTNKETFLIHFEENTGESTNNLTKIPEKGDQIQLTISAFSRELLAITYKGEVLYQAHITSTIDIIVCISFFCVTLAFIILAFVVINIKTSNKKIRKIQRQLLSLTYK